MTTLIWGGDPKSIPPPEPFNRTIDLLGRTFPSYRLFVLVVGLLVALGLYFLLEKTQIGALVRAGVSDKEMVRGRASTSAWCLRCCSCSEWPWPD